MAAGRRVARHTALGERRVSRPRLGDQRPWPSPPPPWAWRRSHTEGAGGPGGPAAKYPDSGQALAETLSPLSGQVAATLPAFCGLYLEPGRTRGGCGLARLLRHFSTPTSPFRAGLGPGAARCGRVSTHLGGRSHTLAGDAPRPERELPAQWVGLAEGFLGTASSPQEGGGPQGRRQSPEEVRRWEKKPLDLRRPSWGGGWGCDFIIAPNL